MSGAEGGTSVCIADLAFRLPRMFATIAQLRDWQDPALAARRDHALRIPKLKGATLDEVERVHSFTDEVPGELVLDAVREVTARCGLDPATIPLIIDYSTTSRDSNGLSLGYRLQGELGASDAVVLAVGNGSCVGFHLALLTAKAFMAREQFRWALLFSEDRTQGFRYNPPFNVLGDGVSAVLLRRGGPGLSVGGPVVVSRGELGHILGIAHWREDNFDYAGFEQRVVPLHYFMIRDVVDKALAGRSFGLDKINLVLYQNTSESDFQGVAQCLGIGRERIFAHGIRRHGHIFGSDLVINLAMARQAGQIGSGFRGLMVSSGAGFSWGATVVEQIP